MKNLKKILLIAIVISASIACSAQEPDPFAPLGRVQHVWVNGDKLFLVTEDSMPTVIIHPHDAADNGYELRAHDYDRNRPEQFFSPIKFDINGEIAFFVEDTVYLPSSTNNSNIRQEVSIRGLKFIGYEESINN